MGFLELLETIRCPALDFIFLWGTRLGEEIVFTFVILGTLWCFNKKMGFWMFFSWGAGTGINQLLKVVSKIPRPWVRNASFRAVDAAIPAATGYSFPSGHVQSAFGLFASLALFIKKRVVTIIAVVLISITLLSRMYLGVHTPADVFGAVAIGLVVLFVMARFIKIEEKKPWISWVACAILVALSLALLIYSNLTMGDGSDENTVHAAENAWKLLGASIGLTAAWQADRKFIHFDTRAVWYAQLIKLLIGIGAAFSIQTLLKQPLLNLFGGAHAADAVRYLLLTLFAGLLYPLTFKYFAKMGRKGE